MSMVENARTSYRVNLVGTLSGPIWEIMQCIPKSNDRPLQEGMYQFVKAY